MITKIRLYVNKSKKMLFLYGVIIKRHTGKGWYLMLCSN